MSSSAALATIRREPKFKSRCAGAFALLSAWSELESWQDVVSGSFGHHASRAEFRTRLAPSPVRRRRARLTWLSCRPGNRSQRAGMTIDAVVLDTAQSAIEPSPQGGVCRARPVGGVATSTRFELLSYCWADSVLSLQYCFPWQQTSATFGVFT